MKYALTFLILTSTHSYVLAYCRARNDTAVSNGDIICRKACETDEECTAQNKQCRCDGKCGLSCINPDAKCDIPNSIGNGTVRWNNLKWGGEARYTCNAPFALFGPSVRTCNSSKKWEGRSPYCEKGCLLPRDVPSSYTIEGENGFQVGETYNFKCILGYHTTGNPRRTCISAERGWSKAAFKCHVMMCEYLENVHHGDIIKTMGYAFGSAASVRCHEGYRATSSQVSKCFPTDGYVEWMGKLPSCERITCEEPEPPENGFIGERQDVGNEYGMEISYHCNDGFKIEGPQFGRCNNDSHWGTRPKCVENFDCNFVEDSCTYTIRNWKIIEAAQDAPSHGMQSNSSMSYIVSKPIPTEWSAEYMCLKFKYKINSRLGRLIVEEEFGWPKFWSSSFNDRRGLWINGAVNLYVKHGLTFRFHATAPLTFLANITATPQKCDISCKSPKPKPNSRLLNQTAQWIMDDRAIFQCNNGFHSWNRQTQQQMKTIITCRGNGEWSDIPPQCVEPVCLLRSNHAESPSAVHENRQLFGIGETVRLKCPTGFVLIGAPTLMCLDMLTWDNEIPQCRRNTCGRPPDILLSWPSTRNEIRYNDTVKYSCYSNYVLKGSDTVTCRFDGSFSQLPRCEKIRSCPAITELKNGFVYNEDNSAHFSCRADMFTLIGKKEISCKSNGKWSAPVPTCQEVDPTKRFTFGNFEYLLYMQDSLHATHDTARARCGHLGGNLAIIYNGALRRAIEKKVKQLNIDGFYVHFGRTTRGWDLRDLRSDLSYAQKTSTYTYYKSFRGYEKCSAIERRRWPKYDYPWTTISCSRAASFICQRNHRPCHWISCANGGTCDSHRGSARCACVQGYSGKRCENAEKCSIGDLDPSLVILDGDHTQIYTGSRVLVSCPDKYRLAGPDTILCKSNAKWSSDDQPSICEEIVCPDPSRDGVILMNNNGWLPKYTVRTEIEFGCEDDEMTLFGNTRAVCEYSGQWSNPTASCMKLSCAFPNLPQFTYVDDFDDQADEFPSGTVLHLKCQNTHIRTGTNHIWRCSNGTWIKSDTKCVVPRCVFPHLPQFSYTTLEREEFPSGTVLQLYCEQGRILTGDDSHRWRCDRGEWIKSNTRCELTYCTISPTRVPKYMKIGTWRRSQLYTKKFQNGTKLNIACKFSRKLFSVNNSTVSPTIACNIGGRWSPSYTDFSCGAQSPTSLPRPTTVESNICQDVNENCHYWMDSCGSREYVRLRCKKTCGLCENDDERK